MTRGARPHRTCPLCASVIPSFRALCPDCFNTIPWERRADFLHAYQRRIRDYPGYEEELASLLMWKKSFDDREEGEKDIEPDF